MGRTEPAGPLMKIVLWCLLLLAAASARADAADCGKNHLILDAPAGCWEAAIALDVRRAGHTATLLADGRVLIAGGGGDAGTSVEIYDPSSAQWTNAASLHLTRAGHTATLLADGRVLVLGGHEIYIPPSWPPGAMSPTSARVLNDDTGEVYDPAADTWTSIPGPLTPRGYFSATLLLDGRVLVAGGLGDTDNTLGSCELYDPATGQWTKTGSIAEPRAHAWITFWTRWGHSATRLADGRVLLAGGFEDDWTMNVVAEAELYDPATGLWSPAGTLSDARGYHTATLLADGRVMVAGGDWRHCPGSGGCGEGTLATTEIYDVSANAWSPGPQLITPRSFHASTLLRDGSVLSVGGARSTSGIPYFAMALVEEAEQSPAPPARWAPAGSPGTFREGHTATLLGDGSVLVVGGDADPAFGARPPSTSQIYRPPRSSTP